MTAVTLLDALMERGFTPDEGGENWFDLHAGRRTVRVAPDDNTVIVYVLSDYATDWQVTCSDGNPPSVVTAIIDLAIAHAGDGQQP